MMRQKLVLGLVALAVLAAPLPAFAHLMNTGFGPFYDGATHLLVTPEDLLPVLALALLAGLRGPLCGRAVLIALPLAWLSGNIGGMLLDPRVTLRAVTAAVTIALGASVAVDWRLPMAVIAGVAILLGLLNGGLEGIEMAQKTASGLNTVGTACALFLVTSIIAGQVASVRAEWARIAVRVAGSWIAAIGLLMLGWSVRGV
jgi:urease accessory protein